MISRNTLTKIATAYLEGNLDLKPDEISDAVVFIVSYHIKHDTAELPKLVRLYGKPEKSDKKSKLAFYSEALFNAIVDKTKASDNKKATSLLWNLINSMTVKTITESIPDLLTNTSKTLNESLIEEINYASKFDEVH